ncbi:MAG: DegT/DnrJ/EryC1/StrS family aminotransferase [Deltaproteobacteria bacterium]|nr:MAG: DegT/DnrJ/EryC1/StrS family aminotransferase [Deltaproteobacteria bacterium]
MTVKKINMADTRLTEAEITAAVEVLRSGLLRQGPQVAAFEKAFAEFTGAKFAVASSSGTSALHLAYLTFLKPGDEVLVPAFTFFATASAVILAGGKPVFCDVDPETYTLDVADAARKITPRTRALGPVHLFGNAAAVKQVRDLAAKHNLKIVWDAAQAHGTRYGGGDIGGLGDFVCYSFYPTKNLFVGEGGMTLTDSAAAAELMKLYRSHGQGQKYKHTLVGYNYRMTDVEGAIGLAQMTRLPEMLAARRKNGAALTAALSRIDGLALQRVEENSDHSFHQYCFTVDPQRFGMDRDALRDRLQQAGVMSGVHYPLGLHEQPVFQDLYGEISLPVTEDLRSRIMAIPVHHGLSEEDVAAVIAAIKGAQG